MTALERRFEVDFRDLRTDIREEVNNLRTDVQTESRENRAALARRDAAQYTTMGAAVLALVGIAVELLLRVISHQ